MFGDQQEDVNTYKVVVNHEEQFTGRAGHGRFLKRGECVAI